MVYADDGMDSVLRLTDLELLLVKDEMTRISETKDSLRIVHVQAPDDFDRFFLTEECDLKAVYVKGQMGKSLDLQTGWTEHGLRRKKDNCMIKQTGMFVIFEGQYSADHQHRDPKPSSPTPRTLPTLTMHTGKKSKNRTTKTTPKKQSLPTSDRNHLGLSAQHRPE